MNVLPLKGYKSLRALNVFHTLMLGLKMLPSYAHLSYEEFSEYISKLEDSDQEKLIREAALFVELQKDEIEALSCFVTDANNIPYGANNLKNLDPKQLIEIITCVCLEIGKMKVGILSNEEKKN